MNPPAAEVTVCLTTDPGEGCLRPAIESILGQANVPLELLVISADTGSAFAETINAFADQRLRVMTVPLPAETAACRNLALEHCHTPFLAFTTADWILLPGTLQRMIAAIKRDPHIGLAGCQYFDLAGDAAIRRAHFRNSCGFPLNTPEVTPAHVPDLLNYGSLRNHFWVARRTVFDIAGKFDESIQTGIDLAFCLSVLGRFKIRVLADAYCFTRHLKTPGSSAGKFQRLFRHLRAFQQRTRILSRLSNHPALFAPEKCPTRNQLARSLVSHFLKWPHIKSAGRGTLGFPRRTFYRIRKHLKMAVAPNCYQFLTRHFSHWPIGCKLPKRSEIPLENTRIAYYTWNFPALSQTFIQREVRALTEAGISLAIFADTCKDRASLDDSAKALIARTQYLMPLDQKQVVACKRSFRLSHPLRYLNLFIYVLTHRYAHFKSFQSDRFIFTKAVYLAGLLKAQKITHIHAPWADISAFIVLVAARLAGITYSVQGRAHDLHRTLFAYALQEKFFHALFAVTNTGYNQRHLESVLKDPAAIKLHQIYNGVNLTRFQPARPKEASGGAIRILSVARLIEEKGLIYLLQSCADLRARGIRFKCDIIGAPEEPFYLNYHLKLKKLHRRLGLEDHVSFLGALPFREVLQHYQSAGLFVLPCVIAENGGRDIIPNSLIEAMAMQLPVISTTIGGIPEMVENGVSGLLVPPGNPQALTDAMLGLIANPQKCSELGSNARKRVEARFDIQKNIIQYTALFKE